VPTYRLYDTTGDDLGLLEHPGRTWSPVTSSCSQTAGETLVTARVEAEPGSLVALLGVVVAPSPLMSDDAIA
jgi:hypothetical protein